MTKLLMTATGELASMGVVEPKRDLLVPKPALWRDVKDAVTTAIGGGKARYPVSSLRRLKSA